MTRPLTAPHLGDYYVIVRPTPGAADSATLAADTLAALGKNPFTLGGIGAARSWELAAAWTAGHAITDVVVDRAHRLTPERHEDLARMAARAQARLWLVWSSPEGQGEAARRLRERGHHRTRRALVEHLGAHLPSHPPERSGPPLFTPALPMLPTADFPAFLGACRRTLAPQRFDRVLGFYRAAWARTREFLTADEPPRAGPITAFLRDELFTGTPDERHALVRLRAAQAALLDAGWLLSWDTAGLGPEPTRALSPGLDPHLCRALGAQVHTHATAATVIALHLGHSAHLELLRCGSLSPDGARLEITSTVRPGVRGHRTARPRTLLRRSGPALEEVTEAPVVFPAYARVFLAAHRALRVGTQAAPDAPLFVDLRKGHRCSHRSLQNTIRTVLSTLKTEAPWITHPTRQPHITSPSWMDQRGLSLHDLTAPARPSPSVWTTVSRHWA